MPTWQRFLTGFFLVIVNGVWAALPAAAQSYTLTDIPDTLPHGINNYGDIAGDQLFSLNGSLTNDAMVYSNGKLYDLNSQFPDRLGTGNTTARALNDRGQVLIQSFAVQPPASFLYDNGSLFDLDLGDPSLDTHGLDNNGETFNGPNFVDATGSPKSLDSFLPPDESIVDIFAANDRGQYLIETAPPDSSGQDPIVVLDTVKLALTQLIPPTLNGFSDACDGFFGKALNNQAQAAGYLIAGDLSAAGTCTDTVHQAALWENGSWIDIGLLPGDENSEALAINDAGDVVGFSEDTPQSGNRRAFLFSAGQLIDLNSLLPANSGWVLEEATGINNMGQITGYGTLLSDTSGTGYHGFILTPVPSGPGSTNGTVIVQDTTISKGGTATVLIKTDDGTIDLAGLSLTVQYDPAFDLVQESDIQVGPLLASDLASFNLDTPGQLVLGLAGTKNVSGGGVLFQIQFHLPAGANVQVGDQLPITLTAVDASDGSGITIPMGLQSGTVTVVPGAFKGDLNGDGKISIADAILALRFVVGLAAPEGDQIDAGDLNGNGKIDISDVIQILRIAVGLDAPPG